MKEKFHSSDQEHTRLNHLKSNSLLEAIIDSVPAGLLVVNQEGTVLKVNNKFTEMWRIPEEILNTGEDGILLDFINDQLDNPDEFYKKVQALYSMPESECFDSINLKDGRTFERTSKSMFLNGIPHARVWTFLDITSSDNVRDELARKEKLLNTIIENMPDQIYIKDRDSRFILCNTPVAFNCGTESVDHVIGKTDFDFFQQNLADQYFHDEQSIMESGIPLINHEEITVNKVSEDVRWNLSTKVPVKDLNGTVTGLIGINRDITFRKKAEQEIELKNAELVKSNDEKDKFFSIIAHDLRSPFQNFLGFTELMVDELSNLSLEEIRKIAVSLKSSANNLFSLLVNLLEWSQMQRDQVSFNPQELSLVSSVEASLGLIRDVADKKNISIDMDIKDDLKVWADARMFDSLIRNLVFNAVKFTPKGGKINLRATAVAGSQVEISIKDSGIGMNKETLVKLFQLSRSPGRLGIDGEPSTGLGLLLCKEYIEKHGGTIGAESEEGNGSTFYFTLAAAEEK